MPAEGEEETMPAAIVTGSSRGIGRAIARRFARDGYDVCINYVANESAAEAVAETVREEGRAAAVVGADVSDPAAARTLVERAIEELGGVSHLVNNAGIDQHVYTENLDPRDFDRVMDTNVNGAFNVTKAALPSLRAVREGAGAEGSGSPTPSVTNIASILAFTGAPIESHYAASKAGLIGLTKSHARDFAPEIRVNAIAPGHIETDMTADRTPEEAAKEQEAIPLRRFGQPAEIADAAAYLRDTGFVTGETLHVNGGELMR
jgi:3-oxoacyl-[acyl-carrier protein] reductase